MNLMKFVVGCDLEEFKKYCRSAGMHDYFRESESLTSHSDNLVQLKSALSRETHPT
jgi:hypothetical protein